MIRSYVKHFLPLGPCLHSIMFEAGSLSLTDLTFLGGVQYNRYIDLCPRHGLID